jgi:hypothetical protein
MMREWGAPKDRSLRIIGVGLSFWAQVCHEEGAWGQGGSGPSFTPALKFNDTGGAGGGDRNSMYLPLIAGI